MDIRMKNMSGLEASALILKEFPDARILLLTTFSDDEYIIKSAPPGSERLSFENRIMPAFFPPSGQYLCGQTVFGTEIVARIPQMLHSSPSFDYNACDINERELRIIELIANGYSNKEIASELFLSEGTVRNYLSSILDKLQLRDRTQVAVFYYQHK